jgi:GntR family transcriptional regulator, transcriptional repressor for pyruvate dehydrogenase complex
VSLTPRDPETSLMTEDRLPGPVQNFRHPTAASHVAAVLRRMIVGRELPDGSSLPRQEDLVIQFGVSLPSIREALRMLEAEGLVTIQRGNRGGAVVHEPDATGAAFTVGLVLESQRTALKDVGDALGRVEVECGVLCAQAEDRAERIVPVLAHLNAMAEMLSGGPPRPYVDASRYFHDALIELSGSRPLTVLCGALSVLWQAQLDRIARTETPHVDGQRFVSRDRSSGLRAHHAVVDAITEGDTERVRRTLTAHNERANSFWTGVEGMSVVDVTSDGLEALRVIAQSARSTWEPGEYAAGDRD